MSTDYDTVHMLIQSTRGFKVKLQIYETSLFITPATRGFNYLSFNYTFKGTATNTVEDTCNLATQVSKMTMAGCRNPSI